MEMVRRFITNNAKLFSGEGEVWPPINVEESHREELTEEVEEQFRICTEICSRTVDFIMQNDRCKHGSFIIETGFGNGLEGKLLDRVYNDIYPLLSADPNVTVRRFGTTVLLLQFGNSELMEVFILMAKSTNIAHRIFGKISTLYNATKKTLGYEVKEDYDVLFHHEIFGIEFCIYEELKNLCSSNPNYIGHYKFYNTEKLETTERRCKGMCEDTIRDGFHLSPEAAAHAYSQAQSLKICDSGEIRTDNTDESRETSPESCGSIEVNVYNLTDLDIPVVVSQITNYNYRNDGDRNVITMGYPSSNDGTIVDVF